MLSKLSILLVTPFLADAKLWGWPDEFTISSYGRLYAYPKWGGSNAYYMCNGIGNYCNLDQCEKMQHFDWSGRFPTKHVYLQKGTAAWMDLWRVDGTQTTYNMYEQSGDGTIHGQCQTLQRKDITCEYNGFTSDKAMPYLHCQQW